MKIFSNRPGPLAFSFAIGVVSVEPGLNNIPAKFEPLLKGDAAYNSYVNAGVIREALLSDVPQENPSPANAIEAREAELVEREKLVETATDELNAIKGELEARAADLAKREKALEKAEAKAKAANEKNVDRELALDAREEALKEVEAEAAKGK